MAEEAVQSSPAVGAGLSPEGQQTVGQANEIINQENNQKIDQQNRVGELRKQKQAKRAKQTKEKALEKGAEVIGTVIGSPLLGKVAKFLVKHRKAVAVILVLALIFQAMFTMALLSAPFIIIGSFIP